MRSKKFSVLLGSAILTLALPLSALAASENATTPGTPGEPNCKGQTNSFLAQAFKEEVDAPGLGNIARFAGLSVKEVQAIVTAFCNSEL